ncbi:hypothetical protein EJB05_44005, partial [Eragrostis curvula]
MSWVLMLLQLSAAASEAGMPAMGLPAGCDIKCGHVSVPYLFGIAPNCSYPAPGCNLTCDRSRGSPRLFLGDGTLQVAEISLATSTVRAVGTGGVRIGRGGAGVWRGAGMGDEDRGPFTLMPGDFNELVVTVHVDEDTIVSGCSSFCSKGGAEEFHYGRNGSKYGSGIGYCQVPIPEGSTSLDVRFKWLNNDSATHKLKPVHVFVVEVDWFDKKVGRDILRPKPNRRSGPVKVPVILQWAIQVETMAATDDSVFAPPCDARVARNICKSEQSYCTDSGRGYQFELVTESELPSYLICDTPTYLIRHLWLMQTSTSASSHKKSADVTVTVPTRTVASIANAREEHTATPPFPAAVPDTSQVSSYISLTIGLLAASGPAFVILVLSVFLILRKINQDRAKKLKQKFFKQNRGQLLQQMLSQRADIAEKMIIPLQELEKATNNFDQSRKLGGGGHGTVYKGILSDLHVVAVKMSNVMIQDIKSDNILLDDSMTAKVSDFGASRCIPTDQHEATMTAVKGTRGYLDPMYFYTRQIPTSYLSQEGNGLVAQFNALIAIGNLAQILDPQVVDEGGTEIEEVSALAVSCTKYRGEERPSMRQVEMALEAFEATKEHDMDNVLLEKFEENIPTNHLLTRRMNTEEGSRQYSLEEEFLMSASYPR